MYTTTLLVNQNIQIKGSNVVGTHGTRLAAAGDIKVEAATNAFTESHFRNEETSGIFGSGGFGFTIGTKEETVDSQGKSTQAAPSTVGSILDDVVIKAGKVYAHV